MINHFTLTGRLTRDPETKDSGTHIRIAVYNGPESTKFFSLAFLGNKYKSQDFWKEFKKGQRVTATGKLSTYKDDDFKIGLIGFSISNAPFEENDKTKDKKENPPNPSANSEWVLDL